MKHRYVTLGLVQSKVSNDPDENLRKTAKMVREAARKGANIICLQELYRSPYFPQAKRHDVSEYLEPAGGPSVKAFAALAKELGVVVIVPIFEKAGNSCYNSAVVVDERGRILPTYRKLHIPHDPGFYEQDYFEQGNLGYRVYKTKFGTFAVLICFDQWFPEAARAVKLLGAEMIFYPTAIGNLIGYLPPEGDWHDAWETIQRGHAIANSVVVAAVNRTGVEGKTRFWGQSFVADAFGNIRARGSAAKDEVVIAKVDISMNKEVEEGWGFMRNRRPDTYRLDKNPAHSGKIRKVPGR